MSHNMDRYLLPPRRDFHDFRQLPWTVREPGPGRKAPTLIDLTDGITERLDKAEAIARLLINEDTALEPLPAVAWTIADLIREARELYDQQWQRVRPGGQG
jgi:hypothetical protein